MRPCSHPVAQVSKYNYDSSADGQEALYTDNLAAEVHARFRRDFELFGYPQGGYRS